MNNLISRQALFGGDILFYRGTGWLSEAICFFDDTPYSHASLHINNNTVIEAIAKGVVKTNIDTSMVDSDYVAIMRHHNRQDLDMTPVISKASDYLGKRYACEQLVLLALICIGRKILLNNPFAMFINGLLERATTEILKITQGDREALICSELVYRAYDETIIGHGDRYTIYLKKDLHLELMSSSNKQAYPFIHEGSLLSHFYGINRTPYFNKGNIRPFLEKTNVGIKINYLPKKSESKNDAELEELFNAAKKSYVKIHHHLDRQNEIELKNNLDTFITAQHYAISKNKEFSRSDNSNNVLQKFFATNANLVTPGVLYKSRNLQEIGRIK